MITVPSSRAVILLRSLEGEGVPISVQFNEILVDLYQKRRREIWEYGTK